MPRPADASNGASSTPAHGGAGAAPAARARAAGYAIGPAFALLAAWFLFGPDLLDAPGAKAANVSRKDVTSDPLRPPPRHPPVVQRGGYELGCMECHRLFVSPAQTPRDLTQHQEIVFNHGLNDRCFNCHDRFSRDRLVLPGGELIRFDEAPRLCATCHGTVYRDWEIGAHGRTTGSWIASRPEHRRLACVECHDPHAPAFDPMTPLPGPNTIRMPTPGRDLHADRAGSHEEPREHTPQRRSERLLQERAPTKETP